MKEAQGATQSLRKYYDEKLLSQYNEHEDEIVDSRENHKNRK